MIKAGALSHLKTSPRDEGRLLSELICLMKSMWLFCSLRRWYREQHLRLRDTAASFSPGFLSFGLLCAGECPIQLEENNKPRLAAFIPHHLGKDGVIMISVCLEKPRSSSHLAEPALFPLLLKSQRLFPYVYFVAAGLPSENLEGIEPKLRIGWILRAQSSGSGCRFHLKSSYMQPRFKMYTKYIQSNSISTLFLHVLAFIHLTSWRNGWKIAHEALL